MQSLDFKSCGLLLEISRSSSLDCYMAALTAVFTRRSSRFRRQRALMPQNVIKLIRILWDKNVEVVLYCLI